MPGPAPKASPPVVVGFPGVRGVTRRRVPRPERRCKVHALFLFRSEQVFLSSLKVRAWRPSRVLASFSSAAALHRVASPAASAIARTNM